MTFDEFTLLLRSATQRVGMEVEVALAATTNAAAESARGYIGQYQGAVGPVPGWVPLADSTREQKERLGYSPPDNPLLRTGEMRDSIRAEVEGMIGRIGSNSEIALYQEMGTSKMPPRPFLSRAVWEHIPMLEVELEAALTRLFARP